MKMPATNLNAHELSVCNWAGGMQAGRDEQGERERGAETGKQHDERYEELNTIILLAKFLPYPLHQSTCRLPHRSMFDPSKNFVWHLIKIKTTSIHVYTRFLKYRTCIGPKKNQQCFHLGLSAGLLRSQIWPKPRTQPKSNTVEPAPTE